MRSWNGIKIKPKAETVNRLLTIVRYVTSKQCKSIGFFKKSVEDSISEEELLSSDNDKSDKNNEDDKPGRNGKLDEDAQVVSPSSLAGPSTKVTVAHKIKKPSIWTDEIRNPWLLCKNGKLGCGFCRSTKSLAGSHSSQGVHLSSE